MYIYWFGILTNDSVSIKITSIWWWCPDVDTNKMENPFKLYVGRGRMAKSISHFNFSFFSYSLFVFRCLFYLRWFVCKWDRPHEEGKVVTFCFSCLHRSLNARVRWKWHTKKEEHFIFAEKQILIYVEFHEILMVRINTEIGFSRSEVFSLFFFCFCFHFGRKMCWHLSQDSWRRRYFEWQKKTRKE